MGSKSTSTDPEKNFNGDDNLLVKSVLCCEENCYKQILVVEIERGSFLSSKLVYCCLQLNHNASHKMSRVRDRIPIFTEVLCKSFCPKCPTVPAELSLWLP